MEHCSAAAPNSYGAYQYNFRAGSTRYHQTPTFRPARGAYSRGDSSFLASGRGADDLLCAEIWLANGLFACGSATCANNCGVNSLHLPMSTPAEVLSDRDPGDDMQRRLRYQAAYGALLCLECVDNEGFSEVFCEHHEDFLVRTRSGLYVAVQVKTRAMHLGAFRSNETPVTTALARFVQLDKEFPSSFEAFVLVANCDFLDTGDHQIQAQTGEPILLRRAPAVKLECPAVEWFSQSTGTEIRFHRIKFSRRQWFLR